VTRSGDGPPRDPVEGLPSGGGGTLLVRVEVITIGVHDFATALWSQAAPCVHVDWAPPPPEDDEMRGLLDRLL
jgi:hypothetical protein